MIKYIDNNFTAIVGLLILLLFVINGGELRKKRKQYFLWILLICAIELCVANIENYLGNQPTFSMWRVFLSAVGYSLRPLIIYMVVGLTIDLDKFKKKFKTLSIPLIINTVLAFSAFVSPIAYGFNHETNSFYRGPLGYSFFVILIFYLFVIGFEVAIMNNKHTPFFKHVTYAIIAELLLAMYLEVNGGSFGISRTSIILAIVFYYIFFQSTEHYRDTDAITYIAQHDGLTNLYNRYAYELFIEKYRKSQEPLGFVILDIDKFKTINDTYGHVKGDLVLKKVAQLLSIQFSQYIVIRLGGDEFVILCPNATMYDAKKFINKINYINDELDDTSRSDLPPTSISVGVAFSKEGFTDELYKKADYALYTKKNTTRRGCAIAQE